MISVSIGAQRTVNVANYDVFHAVLSSMFLAGL
jgi:hypothetical protein